MKLIFTKSFCVHHSEVGLQVASMQRRSRAHPRPLAQQGVLNIKALYAGQVPTSRSFTSSGHPGYSCAPATAPRHCFCFLPLPSAVPQPVTSHVLLINEISGLQKSDHTANTLSYQLPSADMPNNTV